MMNEREQQPDPATPTFRVRVGRYMAIFARTGTGYSAHVPSLPGLGVTGDTLESTQRLLREGIALHRTAIERDRRERPWLYVPEKVTSTF